MGFSRREEPVVSLPEPPVHELIRIVWILILDLHPESHPSILPERSFGSTPVRQQGGVRHANGLLRMIATSSRGGDPAAPSSTATCYDFTPFTSPAFAVPPPLRFKGNDFGGMRQLSHSVTGGCVQGPGTNFTAVMHGVSPGHKGIDDSDVNPHLSSGLSPAVYGDPGRVLSPLGSFRSLRKFHRSTGNSLGPYRTPACSGITLASSVLTAAAGKSLEPHAYSPRYLTLFFYRGKEVHDPWPSPHAACSVRLFAPFAENSPLAAFPLGVWARCLSPRCDCIILSDQVLIDRLAYGVISSRFPAVSSPPKGRKLEAHKNRALPQEAGQETPNGHNAKENSAPEDFRAEQIEPENVTNSWQIRVIEVSPLLTRLSDSPP
nr:putative cytochrome C biosynthesis protein [Ipomoea batatas]